VFKYVAAFVACLLLMLLLQQGCDKMRSRRWDHRKEQREHREERRDEIWDRRRGKPEPDDTVPPFDRKGIFRRRAREDGSLDEFSEELDSLTSVG